MAERRPSPLLITPTSPRTAQKRIRHHEFLVPVHKKSLCLRQFEPYHAEAMKGFANYARELEVLVLDAAAKSGDPKCRQRIEAALDGEPSARSRASIPIDDLRSNGAFFTSRELAKQLISTIEPQLVDGAVVSDVACGTGNLLTACAYHLPILSDVGLTLELWGRLLSGTDIHEEFVRTTRARIALVALERGAPLGSQRISLESSFPQITVGDAFHQTEIISQAECIPLNPPFTTMTAPLNCTWATGKVSTAALMLETCVLNAKPGTRIVAILPEVLRTGSHYLRWRWEIERIARIDSVEVVGLFDLWTDVDVFILRLTVGRQDVVSGEGWWKSDERVQVSAKRFGDLFEVRVGPVVPHRDPHLGSWYPFIHAHDLPAWTTVNIDESSSHRRFPGTTYTPPFVVVRRTSRPGDKKRAVSTVIRGKRTVAVENHLVVLKPKDGLLRTCRDGLEKLQSSDTDVWLNERIRCRHLTVSSIGEIPW